MKTSNETEPTKASDDGNVTMTAEQLRELVNLMLHKRGALDKEAVPKGLRQADGKSVESTAKVQADSTVRLKTDGEESSLESSSKRENRDSAKVTEHDGDDDDTPASDAEVGECDGDDDDTMASDAEIDEDDDEEDDDDESEDDEETGPLAGFLAGGIVGGLAGLLVGGIIGSIVESRD